MGTEVTGVVLGGLALPTLFSTAVECLDYVTLGRKHGKDYELAVTKMGLLKVRLDVVGEVLESQDLPPSTEDAARNALGVIHSCFDDVEELKKSYGLEELPSPDQSNLSAASSGFRETQAGFEAFAKRRQKSTSLTKKTWWAVRDIKEFEGLVQNVNFFVESLEKITDASRYERIMDECLSQIRRSQPARKLLQDAEEGMPFVHAADATASEAEGTNSISSEGHRCLRHKIFGKGKMVNGDIDAPRGYKHLYQDGVIYGGGQVVNGNMSAEAMTKFFGP